MELEEEEELQVQNLQAALIHHLQFPIEKLVEAVDIMVVVEVEVVVVVAHLLHLSQDLQSVQVY